MLPLFKDGQMIVGQRLDETSGLKKFEIIIVESDNKFVCHYFWKSFKNFQTGQNDIIQTRPLNPFWGYDHPISISKVRAKVLGPQINLALKMLILFVSFFKKD